MGFELNLDLKQHINLSTNAWNCIYSDIQNFSTKGKTLTMNGLLNLIILNYWQEAEASISLRLDSLRQRLRETIKSKDKREDIINQLVEIEEKRLREVNAYSLKGKGKQFLINTRQAEILTLDCNEEEYYGGKAGKYLHSLFEEYTRLPYYKRERIVYGETVKTIERAIRGKYTVKITTDGRTFDVQPYKFLSDTDNTYNYLVGYSTPANKGLSVEDNSENEKTIASFRLSRISHITIMHNNRNTLSDYEADSIDDAIKERGIAFLIGKAITIKVKLSPVGVNLYSVILQGRPSFVRADNKADSDGWTEYEFYCTERQAMNYFARLGKEAVVVEPEELIDRMIQNLESSLENYKKIKRS